MAICTLDPNGTVELLRRVRCAVSIFRPEDLKTQQYVLSHNNNHSVNIKLEQKGAYYPVVVSHLETK